MELKGTPVAKAKKEELEQYFEEIGYKPTLAVVMAGENPSSLTYVKGIQKDCEQIGIYCKLFSYSENVSQNELLSSIQTLNNDDDIDAIFLQMPFPKHIDRNAITAAIAPSKDADCLTAENYGKMMLGLPGVKPCTPAGIISLLDAYKIPISGAKCTVIGRSNIVGKPISAMLTQRDATVTNCHSKTKAADMAEALKNSDIVVCAVGKEKFLTADMIASESVVVDVGINFNADGKMCGDVDQENVRCKAITPVPGGVGAMTRTMIFENVKFIVENNGKLDQNCQWKNLGDINFMAWGGRLIKQDADCPSNYYVFDLNTEAGNKGNELSAAMYYIDIDDVTLEDLREILQLCGLDTPENKAKSREQLISELTPEMVCKECISIGKYLTCTAYECEYPSSWEDFIVSREQLESWMNDIGAGKYTK